MARRAGWALVAVGGDVDGGGAPPGGASCRFAKPGRAGSGIAGRSGGRPAAQLQATINRYCVSCHSDRLKTAGLTLQGLDPANPGEHADVWERVVRKMRAGQMPPVGMPRPDQATYDGLVSSPAGRTRPPRRRQSESRPSGAAPDEPRRVRQRRPRPARPERGRRRAAPARRFRLRLRQHRRPARGVAGHDRALPCRGGPDQRRWRSATCGCCRRPRSTACRQDASQDQHIDGLPLGTVGGLRGHADAAARRRVRAVGRSCSAPTSGR